MLILVICDLGKNIFLLIHLKMSRLLMLGILGLPEMVIVGSADCSFSGFILWPLYLDDPLWSNVSCGVPPTSPELQFVVLLECSLMLLPTFLEALKSEHELFGYLENWILLVAIKVEHFAHFLFSVADVNRRVFAMFSVLMKRVTRMALATKREYYCGQGVITIILIVWLNGHSVNIVYRVVHEYV